MNQNSSQPLGINQATAIVVAGGVTYVLDNGRNTNVPSSNGQIFAYSAGVKRMRCRRSLTAYIPDYSAYTFPNYVIAANNGKWLYVLNQGDNSNTTNPQSGIAAFIITTPFQLIANCQWRPDQRHRRRSACAFLRIRPTSSSTPPTSTVRQLLASSIDENSGNLNPAESTTKAKTVIRYPVLRHGVSPPDAQANTFASMFSGGSGLRRPFPPASARVPDDCKTEPIRCNRI